MVEFLIDSFPMLDGIYRIVVGIQSRLGGMMYDWREPAGDIEVCNPGRATGALAVPLSVRILHGGTESPVFHDPVRRPTPSWLRGGWRREHRCGRRRGHRRGRAGAGGTADAAPEGADTDEGASLATVMAEIDQEVRRRRASGDLPARVERELDALFLQYSPVAGRGGCLADALHMVDAAAYIDPVVPVGSEKSGGAVVKKGVRRSACGTWAYITHQVEPVRSLGEPGPAPARRRS